jgi:phage shock protein PspC (stress-responsive transcriptional regulator)
MIGFAELPVAFAAFAILAYILFWVYKDASKRYPAGSYKPVLWVLVVLFTHLVGLILYILLRPDLDYVKSETD